MFNRIRISTTLFLILILCGILQIGSNGMSFWAFRDDLQRLNQVEQSNQQRAALAQTRAVMLQASTALNKAGTLTALSYPADDIKTLMTTARASLTQSTTLFKSFMAMTAGNEHVRALQKETEKSFARWHNDLEHQATWLESNQLSDFLTAPVQESQNAFDVNFEAWQLEINHVLEAASAQSQRNYQISALVFISMIIVAAIYISSALWWTRKMIVQPLAIIGSHFDSIAAGNLARPIAVYGRNEITAIFASLKTMQQALRGTVSDVRKGSHEMHIGIAEIVAGNNDLSSRTEQQAASLAQTAASMEQLTATVGQNADNARQASQPHQDQMEKSAKALTQRWDDWFADPIDLADARELVTDTRQFLADVPAHTSFTNAQLLEIMMAQDFQDLTGQVIKRMMDVIQEIERQLLMVLLENIPEQESRPKRENQSLLNGPQVDTSKAGVVASQDQVDDLLDSLGF